MDKKTDELMQILRRRPNAKAYLKENEGELLRQTLPELLQGLLETKNLKKSDVIRDADLDRTYGYQIFDGRHRPSRDKLLRLSFGLRLTVPETQRLLKAAQMPPLYPRIVRDVLILECLFQEKDVLSCNESLEANGQEPLR